MEIRKTTLQDVDTVLDVFAAAKRYMRANGNASQWGDEYPDRSIVTYDIACGSSYVMLENGEIVKLAREQHIPKLHAEIYSFNAQSQRMFERAGFHKAGDELYEMEL